MWLKYDKNPNGSAMDIAGVTNKKKNVAGLMPHPERAMTPWMGSDDGKIFFESVLK
ncbi:phosphoribosylformylglycinamidine synthase subunit PurQ [bacterium]|nr:phosphoribosylformylglycinamidine synthase subunit PurQ [bacterium]